MYPNLEAELARRGLNYRDIGLIIGKSERTATNKLNNSSPFTLDECLAIRDYVAEDKTLDYLFEINE